MRIPSVDLFSIIIIPVFIFIVFNSQGSIRFVLAWNFSDLGLPQNILIWRFTIWRNRAFLSVPRWEKKAMKIPFTLLEAPWPETGIPLQIGVTIPEVVPFPDAKTQEEDNCQHLQSVTGLDSDYRGRLWILDSPTRSSRCKIAKIIIYDLRRNEKIVETELHGVASQGLKCLIIDPVIGQQGSQAYITDPGDETIIVYNLAQNNWWRLKLSGDSYGRKMFSTDLAIAKKSSTMYITGYSSHDLFSVDLDSIRNEAASFFSDSKNDSIPSAKVSWVGSKMGTSSGLICDFRGGLHYFLVTELASVRWDSRHKLDAEGHSIFLQSESVPCITDYAQDFQKNIWGIINDVHPFRNGTNYSSKNLKDNKNTLRTIKIYKYNPFVL